MWNEAFSCFNENSQQEETCVCILAEFTHFHAEEQHGYCSFSFSVPASWSLEEAMAVLDLCGRGGGPESTKAEEGLREEGEGVSTIGVDSGLQEGTNPDPP